MAATGPKTTTMANATQRNAATPPCPSGRKRDAGEAAATAPARPTAMTSGVKTDRRRPASPSPRSRAWPRRTASGIDGRAYAEKIQDDAFRATLTKCHFSFAIFAALNSRCLQIEEDRNGPVRTSADNPPWPGDPASGGFIRKRPFRPQLVHPICTMKSLRSFPTTAMN